MTINEVLIKTKALYPHEKEFLQAVEEVFSTLVDVDAKYPEFASNGIYERLVEPERIIIFRVSWLDDQGKIQVNRAYRVQFNSALGPYKGGLRFRDNVNLSIIKFLGFEQIFKNALTGLLLGGAKGGSDFDPKGKSDMEIMRFCQSFMNELYRHIGPYTDIPAGDIGVGKREIAYLFGQYKKIRNDFTAALTGKDLNFGGSLGRKEATGYGLCYFMDAYLNDHDLSFNGKNVIISGSGNVALYAMQKVISMGGKVIAMSDSDGVIYLPDGLDFKIMQDIKENKKLRIKSYLEYNDRALYLEGCKNIWTIKTDIALPCATQNELDYMDAKNLVNNGLLAVGEGANMPCTKEAIDYFLEKHILFAPAKAANAGGVAVSGLEMSQNAAFVPWTFTEVDSKLKTIMETIYHNIKKRAQEFDCADNLLKGANIEAFMKVADAMMKQGIV